jgi:tricorn protease
MQTPGYYRYPTVHQDQVIFVAEDDLWTVPLTGGVARRLTAGWGAITRPALSPDGRWVAFVGKEEGDTEVYVMPADGGEVRRLTYLGAGATVQGWTPDGHIVFSTYARQPFLSLRHLWTISPEGGEPQPLPYGPAVSISFGPQGRLVLGRPTTEAAYWKRYRGGTRGMLWIDRQGTGDFERFQRPDGNLVNPLWIGERIYVISDHEGIGNLYALDPATQDLQRLTHHQDYYVRNASTDGTTIVYHAGGRLYAFDVATQREREIAVTYASQKTQREIKYVDAAEFWSEYTLSERGERVLVTTRGKLFALAPFEGPVTPVGLRQGARYRLSQFLPNQSAILTVSDEGGEDGWEWHALDATTPSAVRRIFQDFGLITEVAVSPNGQFAAFATERQELWLLDLKTDAATRLVQSRHGRFNGINWAPDSQWLAYALPVVPEPSSPTNQNALSAIFLYHLSTRRHHQVTRPVLSDRRPVFDPQGRYLYFLSRRTYVPVWDNMKFDLGFPQGEKPYLIPLAKTTRSPFLPDPRPLVPASDDKAQKPAREPIAVDLDGIQERVIAFPVAEGLYLDLQATDSHVFWTTVDPEGIDEDDWFLGPPSARATLHRYDLTELKEETVAERVTSFRLSPDGKVLAIRAGKQLRLIKATDKVDAKDDKPGRQSGIVDLARIAVPVDPAAEWQQMLREAWRLMRELFWTPTMAAVDWDQVYAKYQALLPRIATRSELSDLIWEMQGELGTSHAYEIGGEYRREPAHRIGFLGADLSWDPSAQGWRIRHLVRGDSWDPDRHSPLLAPGLNVQEGDVMVAVNGQPLGPDLPPAARLIDLGRKEVQVTIQSANDGVWRTHTVRALSKETPARYREWVNANRQRVHEATQGRVGYIHIPNMGSAGFAEFHRGYLAEYDREGLIIDVRFNGGGLVSPLLLEMLARRRIAFTRTRLGHVEPYPYQSPTGAMVAVTNEFAGSDGDIFSHAFKLMGLGPLIGTRTWGGVIGINVRYTLVDWTATTQPEEAFWFKDVGWGVENYGTDPDIEVPYRPQDALAGRDPQLERAIAEILKILEHFQPLTPQFADPPSRQAPPLPDA